MDNFVNLSLWGVLLAIAGYIFKEFIIWPLQQSLDRLSDSIDALIARQLQSDKLLVRHDEQIHNLERRMEYLEGPQ